MQQSDFELKNGYQMIPVAIAGVIAVAIGCVIHFWNKIEFQKLISPFAILVNIQIEAFIAVCKFLKT